MVKNEWGFIVEKDRKKQKGTKIEGVYIIIYGLKTFDEDEDYLYIYTHKGMGLKEGESYFLTPYGCICT